MKPIKLPRMTGEEIDELVKEQFLCRIALKGGKYPYLAPFRYVKVNDVLYFHFTDYGKKMTYLKENNNACVQIETYDPDLSSYSFVSFRGSLQIVENETEKQRAIQEFAKTGEKFSPNFLVAHGFSPEKGWQEFSPDKELVIVKLVNIITKIGLKYP